MEPYLGEIRLFAGTYAPRNWHFCDGALLPIAEDEALFSLIGAAFGGDGRTQFALPDLRGRVPVGQGTGTGLRPRVMGQRGGCETVTIDVDHLPSHDHPLNATTNSATTKDPSPDVGFSQISDGAWFYAKASAQPRSLVMNPHVVSNQGGGASHENMMPTMALSYIICLVGLYPPKPS
jgi:microcystin-dependent protein